MDKPVVLLSRLWLNCWQSGHRSAHGSNVCVALAYGSKAGGLLDFKPRKGGRAKISALLFPALVGEPWEEGVQASPRRPDTKMGVETGLEAAGVRIEQALFELKFQRAKVFKGAEMEALARRLEARMARALEPLLGAPLLSRAQWGESEGSFATGGDGGVMSACLFPADRAALADPAHPWTKILREVAAMDEALALGEAAPSAGPQARRPRI